MITLAIGLLLTAAVTFDGQIGASLPWLAALLPREAKVIETATVKQHGRADRALVLWMIDPIRILREDGGKLVTGHSSGGCSDWIYGDHWYGSAHAPRSSEQANPQHN